MAIRPNLSSPDGFDTVIPGTVAIESYRIGPGLACIESSDTERPRIPDGSAGCVDQVEVQLGLVLRLAPGIVDITGNFPVAPLGKASALQIFIMGPEASV